VEQLAHCLDEFGILKKVHYQYTIPYIISIIDAIDTWSSSQQCIQQWHNGCWIGNSAQGVEWCPYTHQMHVSYLKFGGEGLYNTYFVEIQLNSFQAILSLSSQSPKNQFLMMLTVMPVLSQDLRKMKKLMRRKLKPLMKLMLTGKHVTEQILKKLPKKLMRSLVCHWLISILVALLWWRYIVCTLTYLCFKFIIY